MVVKCFFKKITLPPIFSAEAQHLLYFFNGHPYLTAHILWVITSGAEISLNIVISGKLIFFVLSL